jgi:RNA polymerase sigma-70 factor, ECF subfamily
VQQPEVFPHELEERIVAIIKTLPKQCRTIFMMSRYQEMKYAEIAKELDISVNTIENQISKALRILREHFKD